MLAERPRVDSATNGPLAALAWQDALVGTSRALKAHNALEQLLRSLPATLRPLIRVDYLSVELLDGPGTGPTCYRLQVDDGRLAVTCWNVDTAATGQPRPNGVVQLRIVPGSGLDHDLPVPSGVTGKLPLKTVHTLPLATAYRALGRMTVAAEGPADCKDDAALLAVVADQVAVAVDNVLSHGELEREQERLRLLLDLTQRAVSSNPSGDVLRAAAVGARRITRSDAAFVLLPQGQGDQCRLAALDFPGGEGVFQDRAIRPGEGTLAGQVFATGKVCAALGDDALLFDLDREPMLLAGRLRAACALPVMSRNRILGALVLGRREARPYGQEDIGFLVQLSNQVALALDNALAYGELAELKNRVMHEPVSLVGDEVGSGLNFKDIVGQSAALRHVLQQAETVAPTGSTVLIYGETGTGKELIARAIHDLSSRSANPFVRLNCAAIPTGLLESELFGHERGAFTGAIAQRIGRFELANTGTIFLDEVGEIPLELQTKLLRVLQEREFERLGSARVIRTDARLIAATNRDLGEAVRQQQFRADLFYRLNVFPIHLPPLRQRVADIPLLVRYFAQQFARRMSKVIETIPSETMEALTRYGWPGNIRELQNVIERAVILSPGPVLHVPIEDLLSGPAHARDGKPETMEEAERAHILKTLAETRWVLSGPRGAATRLGMNRSTLQFRMKKLGIVRPTG